MISADRDDLLPLFDFDLKVSNIFLLLLNQIVDLTPEDTWNREKYNKTSFWKNLLVNFYCDVDYSYFFSQLSW